MAKNYITFENGIGYELTEKDILVICKALLNVNIDDDEKESLKQLKSLFLDFLD